ncbi:amino acid ABC transporter substrate-binding protein [Marisediminicola sp. LYQ134]|uniref:amino acid ABC transporter substrate-binding protein n=1 Tax=Marisediminicola sp. LYQ134 TaxID=3391061 RepID=UPI003983C8B2
MRTRFLSLAVAATAALALAGCATASSDETAEGDDSLTSVQESGVLTIGTEGTYRPFSFHEDGSGDLTGFDVEIATAVAAELGVEAQFEETQWDAIFAGLEAGRFDVIANQVSITPERLETYVFSEPYTYSTGVIVVPTDDDSIDSFESLEGKTTAQSLTSNWNTLAVESGATVEGVEGWAQSVALVEQGRVDATINDKLTFLDYEQTTGADTIKVAAETEEQSESAFALAEGSTELADAIDEALESLRADGTLAEISEKYFGADVTE